MILKELLTLFISIKYLDEFGSLSRRNYFRTRKRTLIKMSLIDILRCNHP